MAIKSYGELRVVKDEIIIEWCEPHVSSKIKSIFPKINPTAIPPYRFAYNDDVCKDMIWFMSRYPMKCSASDFAKIKMGEKRYDKDVAEVGKILSPDYKPRMVELTGKELPRQYQLVAADMVKIVRRILIGDDIGVGKTLTAILTLLHEGALPAAIAVQAHMQVQWKNYIESNTNLKVTCVQKTTPYNLKHADVYIFRYRQLGGWSHQFQMLGIRTVIFDEIQELRRTGSQKYDGAAVLASLATQCIGLSATPIYNYGNEIYNVMNIIKEGCLGSYQSFLHEWCTLKGMNKYVVKNPDALGSYLRDVNLMIRRTRKEVGRELPPVNVIVQYIEHSTESIEGAVQIAKTLANKIIDTNISWKDKSEEGLEFNLLIRRITGIAKAKYAAAFIRMIVESGESVLVGAWHRDVYDILMEELIDLEPIMYTGSETPKQKEESKRLFMAGERKVLMMSNRSGAGVDGLQDICDIVVIVELDYSPKVHEQFIGRVDRGNKTRQTTAFYLLCNYGSDPAILELLGIKSSQSHSIMNPGALPIVQHSDESKIINIAKSFLQTLK